jgi:hypothetical protein
LPTFLSLQFLHMTQEENIFIMKSIKQYYKLNFYTPRIAPNNIHNTVQLAQKKFNQFLPRTHNTKFHPHLYTQPHCYMCSGELYNLTEIYASGKGARIVYLNNNYMLHKVTQLHACQSLVQCRTYPLYFQQELFGFAGVPLKRL